MNADNIAQAASILSAAQRAVVLTGAGISRPSGIPDFRSAGGLWEQDDPMDVVSLRTFRTNPQRFFNWLRPLLEVSVAAQPNPAHHTLAELERAGIVKAIMTQNIDSLHQRAGSYVVHELHGHMRSATCISCGRRLAAEPLITQILSGAMPTCACGGAFKPDIVLFDEFLPVEPMRHAQYALEACDVLLIVGTSLEVFPVAELPLLALKHGARLIVVNLTETYIDGYADVVINDDVAVALPAIFEHPAFHYYE